MKSAMALTYELDDMKLAAKQLADQIKKNLNLGAQSLGVLYADSELNHKNLLSALRDELPIEIMGCTVMGILEGAEGFHEMCTSLVVMTGDDFTYSITLSDPVTSQNVYDVIEQTYTQGCQALGDDVKLIFALPPYNLDIMLDEFPETFSKLSGGLPVYGGLPSYNKGFGLNATLGKLDAHTDRLILLLLGGNVRPLFNVASVIKKYAENKKVVTKSVNNVVYTVGDMTFVDYCNSLGLPMAKLASDESIFAYVTIPLVIETVEEDNTDGVPVVRTLVVVNLKDGSGTAICKVPENSLLSIGSLQGSDIETSAKQGVESLLAQMEENSKDGYEYSIIFCTSCVGRFMVMSPDNDVEGKVLADAVPNHFNLAGFYGFGELGPTSMTNGKAVNRAHNESITMLAL